MKPVMHAIALAAFVALGAQYTVVDADGNIVGTLVTDTPPASLRVIGITNSGRGKTPAQPDRSPDRIFRPDYSRTLTVDQMTRAWRDELDRLNPPVVTGGG